MSAACVHAYLNGNCPFCQILRLRGELAKAAAAMQRLQLQVSDGELANVALRSEVDALRRLRELDRQDANAACAQERQRAQATVNALRNLVESLEAERDAAAGELSRLRRARRSTARRAGATA